MTLQIGLSDGQLRRELGAIRNPTMNSFSEKIEGFEHARRTEPDSAYGNAVSKPAPNRRPSTQGGVLRLVETCHEIVGKEIGALLCAASASSVQRQTT